MRGNKTRRPALARGHCPMLWPAPAEFGKNDARLAAPQNSVRSKFEDADK